MLRRQCTPAPSTLELDSLVCHSVLSLVPWVPRVASNTNLDRSSLSTLHVRLSLSHSISCAAPFHLEAAFEVVVPLDIDLLAIVSPQCNVWCHQGNV
mmetsp:Transcript_18050/g.41480  ORF Transcript_18050/g.41480 Transcript_18050/m.41480 type:complete len:97 (-) Transcript_18050:35-325(-)